MTTATAIIAESPAAVAAPPAPVARRAWGEDFAKRLLGDGATPTAPAASTALSYGKAAALAGMDLAEVGVLGLLAGFLSKRNMLHPGVAAAIGFLGIAGGAAASVSHPVVGRAIGNAGLAGIFAAAFQTGRGDDDDDKEGQPSSPPKSPEGGRNEDPIAAAEREADLL